MSATQADEQAVQAIFDHAATLVREGKSKSALRQDLIFHGLDEQTAEAVTGRLFQLRAQARREAGLQAMGHGALWCIGGLLVTGATFALASGGGVYVVAYGAVIWGGVQFLRGLAYVAGF